ncbi:MAG: hypothetical protein IJI73_07550 [Kiritimatiellae bacterium]|nr:hypothetical protein [Kiritimatiellia bacterium]
MKHQRNSIKLAVGLLAAAAAMAAAPAALAAKDGPIEPVRFDLAKVDPVSAVAAGGDNV